MKAAHTPAEFAKGAAVFIAIIGFFVLVIHQITLALG